MPQAHDVAAASIAAMAKDSATIVKTIATALCLGQAQAVEPERGLRRPGELALEPRKVSGERLVDLGLGRARADDELGRQAVVDGAEPMRRRRDPVTRMMVF